MAADGVSVEEKWIITNLVLFLNGKAHFVALVDTNHNCKNFRYQLMGYSCVLIMGSHPVDTGLFALAGIPQELWRVKDWASDLVVLRMASSQTVQKVAALSESEDQGTVAVMCTSLYFIRLKLFSVNCKKLGFRERVVFSWCSMIWITSFSSKSRLGTNQKNSRINVRNMATETIAMVFAVARNDVIAARFLTTESNEHVFAGYRNHVREPTVLQLNQMEERRSNRTNAIFESGLAVSRTHGNGYNASFSSYVDGARSLSLSSGADAGPVKLLFGDTDDAVVDQLWDAVGPIINSTFPRMQGLLNRFGVRSEDMSPFLRHFNSPSDLLSVYLTLVPPGIVGGTGCDDAVDDDEVEAMIAAAARVDSEDGDLTTLSEAIGLVMGGDANSTTNIDTSEVEDAAGVSSDLSTAGDDDAFAVDPSNLAEAGKQFFRMFQSTTMQEQINASVEGISLLHLKSTDRGSTTDLQKYKTLQGRWFGSKERKKQEDGADEDNGGPDMIIERGMHVKLQVSEGKGRLARTEIKDFVVMSVATKTYNRWYMCEKGKQTWKRGIKEGKFRFEARMIRYDHGVGMYECVSPIDSEWEAKSIFVLADASDIKEVGGRINFILE